MSNAWVLTASGVDVDLLDPTPGMIRLGDIAHSLARLARFAGHTIASDLPWNVAQHSLLVESLMPEDSTPEERLVALLHDAHETYIGDIVSPVLIAMDTIACNHAMDGNYVGFDPSRHLNEIARRLDTAIHAAFGLSPSAATLAKVKAADLLALRIEADALMPPRGCDWPTLPPAPAEPPTLRPCHPPARAMAVFLDRFDRLTRERHGLPP